MPKGIIISNISNLYHVEIEDGKQYACHARGKFKNDEMTPVAGDRVEIEVIDEEKKTGVINQIEDRINEIKRPKMANVTQIIFVVSMKLPQPDLELLDKQLAYAEYMKIKPVICLNKIDLAKEEQMREIEEIYQKIGYHVIQTNAKGEIDLAKLKEILKGHITAFSGNSGVGKSTLINRIFEKNISEEGQVSVKNQRGKNTTTQVRLYRLEGEEKSYIADTPGFSTFALEEIEAIDLSHYFIEFIPYIEKCKFVGCSHVKEENCGIKEAVQKNEISQGRYERYCKIYQEMKQKEEKKW